MSKRFLFIALIAVLAVPLAVVGCKAKAEKPVEIQNEVPEASPTTEDMVPTQAPLEPAQMVATETIPPTANPPVQQKQSPVTQEKQDRNKDIQKALKAAGFYAGTVDGKIGPKTKKALIDFQRAKGLKADGKVGTKTWTELEKYLVQ